MYIIATQEIGFVNMAQCATWDDVVDTYMDNFDGEYQWLSHVVGIGVIDKNGLFAQLDMDDLLSAERRDAHYERQNIISLQRWRTI